MPLPPDVGPGRNALQAMGSTLSYAKRYLAEMLFNIVRENEDDDGQAGGTRRIGGDQKAQLVELMMKCREAGDPVNEVKFFGEQRKPIFDLNPATMEISKREGGAS